MLLPMFKTQKPNMTFRRIFLLPAIILLFMTACQPVQGPHTRPQPVQIETLPAEQSGDFSAAADEYLALASEAEGEQQALYYLRAAKLYWQLEQIDKTKALKGYKGQPIVYNEDDHEDFDQPMNNFVAATSLKASWGYFDYRRKGEAFECGYQNPPVDWGINSERKKAFFKILSEW